MPRFKHILFPVDFSERCRAVLPFVESMVLRYNAKLTLMHVVRIPAVTYGVNAVYPAVFDVRTIKEHACHELDVFLDSRMPGIAVERIVEEADPATYIATYAGANGVDLILMPTHGYGKFRRRVLGSVSAKVLHDVQCAVWTATHAEDPNLLTHVNCKSVLCALDLSSGSAAMLAYASELAHDYKAKLRLVHAVYEGTSQPEMDFSDFLKQVARENLAKLQRQVGTNFEVCLESGAVSRVIRAAALHHEADLVIIGRGTLGEAFGRLRTNAYKIIRDSPCPVLSV